MHPETKKLTQKNMPYLTLTLTENLKLQLSPGLVASYDIQPGNGVGLFWDKHTHVYLLTYLPRTPTAKTDGGAQIYAYSFKKLCCVVSFEKDSMLSSAEAVSAQRAEAV